MVDQGVNEAAEALGQSPEKNLKAHKELQEKRRSARRRRAQGPGRGAAPGDSSKPTGSSRYGHPGYGASQGAPIGGVPQGFQQAVTSAAQQAQTVKPLAKAKKLPLVVGADGLRGRRQRRVCGGHGLFGISALVSALAPAVRESRSGRGGDPSAF